ncbi:hypothetical protein C8R46DRAFT_312133 [Mycena filopes]|nr:hypothetical protein C8R46DRAFT_312133 [Mycena filopes]
MALSLFTLALSLAASVSSTPFTTTPPLALAPFVQHQRYGLLNNSYIVVLKPDVHSHRGHDVVLAFRMPGRDGWPPDPRVRGRRRADPVPAEPGADEERAREPGGNGELAYL